MKIKNEEGNVILVPGSVKFDTGNDVATAISHRLLEELGLEPDQSKKIRVTGVGGDMECFRVEIALRIRRRAFKVCISWCCRRGHRSLDWKGHNNRA